MKSAALCALLISVVTQMGVYAQTKMYGVNVTNQAPASSATLALNDENTVSLNLKFNFSASNDLLFDVTAKVNDSTMPGTAWLKWKNHGVTY